MVKNTIHNTEYRNLRKKEQHEL